METNTFDNAANANMFAEPERPQFLSVLCILTWICCSVMFLLILSGTLFKPSDEAKAQQIEQMNKISPEAAEKMEQMFENQDSAAMMINTVIKLIALGLSAYGAFLMWKLKKSGFMIYLIGELLPYIGLSLGEADSMMPVSAATGMSMGTVIGLLIAVWALFDGIFIAMYAANLKHMKQ